MCLVLFACQMNFDTAFADPTIGLVISNVSAQNKVYDGELGVALTFDVNGVAVGDDVSITGTGHLLDGNVGNGKSVTFAPADFVISGADAGKYYIDQDNFPANNYITINVLPYETQVVWGAANTPYVYNGSSFASNITPRFLDKDNLTRTLDYKIKSVSVFRNGVNEPLLGIRDIVLAATYRLSIIENQSVTANYALTNSEFTIEVAKASPELNVDVNSFKYTGEEYNIADFISINNQEQALNVTNGSFTSLTDLQNNPPVISVQASDNYTACTWTYGVDFTFEMQKGDTIFDLSNFVTEYTYTGNSQAINKDDVVINNDEQVVSIDINSVKYVGVFAVTITASESANYKLSTCRVDVRVNKMSIDVANFEWRKSPARDYNFTYNGAEYSMQVYNPSDYLEPVYSGTHKATNAGGYIAKVDYRVRDIYTDFCEIAGTTPDLVWNIKKCLQSVPVIVGPSTFVYNTEEHTLNLSLTENAYFYSQDYKATNAGNYVAKFVLKDPNNCTWSDGSVLPKEQTWNIDKVKLATPVYTKSVIYTGKDILIDVPDSEMYTILSKRSQNVGDHTTYLVLNDAENYAWKDSSTSTLTLVWSIVGRENYRQVPIAALVIVILLTLGGAVLITLKFTQVKSNRDFTSANELPEPKYNLQTLYQEESSYDGFSVEKSTIPDEFRNLAKIRSNAKRAPKASSVKKTARKTNSKVVKKEQTAKARKVVGTSSKATTKRGSSNKTIKTPTNKTAPKSPRSKATAKSSLTKKSSKTKTSTASKRANSSKTKATRK